MNGNLHVKRALFGRLAGLAGHDALKSRCFKIIGEQPVYKSFFRGFCWHNSSIFEIEISKWIEPGRRAGLAGHGSQAHEPALTFLSRCIAEVKSSLIS